MNKSLASSSVYICSFLLLIISYFTFFKGYEEPAAFYWDENYHVAAAQKYLNGVFFMEPHPPLGKLLIAAGEYLFSANNSNDQFLQTDHASAVVPGFSLLGYRFFPVIFATFCPLLLFLVVRVFCSDLIAFFIGILFAFDNALIVHLRGAMLEGIQIFFILVFLLLLAKLFKLLTESAHAYKNKIYFYGLSLGASLGCVLTTKVNGIILLIPLLPIFLLTLKQKIAARFSVCLVSSFLIVFLSVWSIHISLGKKIEPRLPDSGYYKASIGYRLSLQEDSNESFALFSKLYDNFSFLAHYTKGVPELNYCKRDENGSPWYWWLFGGKSINYRWDKNDGLTKFLYLVVNPVGWGLSLFGVFLAFMLIGSYLFFNATHPKKTLAIISTLLFSWIIYIAVFGSLGRVMYLYHYFVPLIMGWIMLAIIAPQIERVGPCKLSERCKKLIMIFFSCSQLASFIFFSPLTYWNEISDQGLKLRNWLSIWDIHCSDCTSLNPLARPIGDPRRTIASDISISGVRAIETYQEWGQPVMNLSVTSEPLSVANKVYNSGIGVHAASRLYFDLKKRFSKFTAAVALPDYIISKTGGSVIFKIYGDGMKLWQSSRISAGMSPTLVNIEIAGIDRLSLEVSDADDGITDDHAVWLEPKFE